MSEGGEKETGYIITEEVLTGRDWLRMLREKREKEKKDDEFGKSFRALDGLKKRIESEIEVLKEKEEAIVPREYRRYVRREDIPKLPKGTRVYEGPLGGLFVDVREIPREVLPETGSVEKPEGEMVGRETSPEISYEGTMLGKLKYSVKVDKKQKKAYVNLTRDDGNHVVLEVDMDRKDIRLKDIKLSDFYKGWIEHIDASPSGKRLRRKYRDDEIYRYLWTGDSEAVVQRFEEILSGNPQTLSSSLLYVGDFGNEKHMNSKILSLGEVNDDSRVRFYYLESLSEEEKKKFVEISKRFKEHFTDKFGSYILYAPYEAIGYVGGFYANQSVSVVANRDLSSVLHEYLHYIYHVFENISILRYSVLRAFTQFVHDVFSVKSKDAFIPPQSFYGDILGRGAPSEVELVAKIFKEKFGVQEAGYDVDENWSRLLIEYFLSQDVPDSSKLSSKDYDNYTLVTKVIAKNILTNYLRLVDYIGGEKVLDMFRELRKLWNDDDGLTNYSLGFHVKKHAHTETEALASMGNLLGFFIRRHKDFYGKFTRENILQFYDDVTSLGISEYVDYRFKFLEGKRHLVEKMLDFLEGIGLVRWEE